MNYMVFIRKRYAGPEAFCRYGKAIHR